MASDIADSRKEYSRELYVEREKAHLDVQAWRNSKKRLLTTTGPPAIGKSWFLKHMSQTEFAGGGKPEPIWIDVREQLSPSSSTAVGNGEIDEERQQKWLQNFINELSSKFDNIPPYDPAIDITALLGAVARRIAEHNPSQLVYVFVDEGDAASNESWRQFELTILEPFASHTSFRFIIALRQDQQMQLIPLRWSEKRLSLGPLIDEKGRQQIKELAGHSPGSVPPVDKILVVLRGYNWSHPGLNAFLFGEVQDSFVSHNTISLGPNYLERGLNSLIPLPEKEKPQIVNWLLEIVRLDDEWTTDNLAEYFSISTSEGWKRRQKLQDYLMVATVEEKKGRYKITDGVREFARAAQAHDQSQMRREE